MVVAPWVLSWPKEDYLLSAPSLLFYTMSALVTSGTVPRSHTSAFMPSFKHDESSMDLAALTSTLGRRCDGVVMVGWVTPRAIHLSFCYGGYVSNVGHVSLKSSRIKGFVERLQMVIYGPPHVIPLSTPMFSVISTNHCSSTHLVFMLCSAACFARGSAKWQFLENSQSWQCFSCYWGDQSPKSPLAIPCRFPKIPRAIQAGFSQTAEGHLIAHCGQPKVGRRPMGATWAPAAALLALKQLKWLLKVVVLWTTMTRRPVV